ncbi:MAG: 23S rRNA (adenine(2503)-C(2))-methyltransferase RlmN, partial [Chitinophagaceae bacterium]
MNATATLKRNGVQNIRQLPLPDLEQYFGTIGEPKFRAKQVWEWIWQKGAQSFADMTNLSKALRQKLGEHFTLPALAVDATQYSADGTIKSRFRTHEGHLCEGVLIPTEDRFTACVSSQIGCSLACKFCATGYIDRKRNIDFDEIYDEVVLLN